MVRDRAICLCWLFSNPPKNLGVFIASAKLEVVSNEPDPIDFRHLANYNTSIMTIRVDLRAIDALFYHWQGSPLV